MDNIHTSIQISKLQKYDYFFQLFNIWILEGIFMTDDLFYLENNVSSSFKMCTCKLEKLHNIFYFILENIYFRFNALHTYMWN